MVFEIIEICQLTGLPEKTNVYYKCPARALVYHPKWTTCAFCELNIICTVFIQLPGKKYKFQFLTVLWVKHGQLVTIHKLTLFGVESSSAERACNQRPKYHAIEGQSTSNVLWSIQLSFNTGLGGVGLKLSMGLLRE